MREMCGDIEKSAPDVKGLFQIVKNRLDVKIFSLSTRNMINNRECKERI